MTSKEPQPPSESGVKGFGDGNQWLFHRPGTTPAMIVTNNNLPEYGTIVFFTPAGELLKLTANGEIILGENAKPDEAAKEFLHILEMALPDWIGSIKKRARKEQPQPPLELVSKCSSAVRNVLYLSSIGPDSGSSPEDIAEAVIAVIMPELVAMKGTLEPIKDCGWHGKWRIQKVLKTLDKFVGK